VEAKDSLLQFTGAPRFQPWAQPDDNRLTRAYGACLWFGWKEGTQVIRGLMDYLAEHPQLETSIPGFLKTTEHPVTATLLGKLSLQRREYQYAYFADRLQDWLVVENNWNSINGNNPIEEISNKVDYLLGCGDKKVQVPISFLDWLANRSWMRPGVTSWKDLVPPGAKATKSSLALGRDAKEIKQRLDKNISNNDVFHWTVHAKPEPMKTRATIVDIMDLYLYMGYASEFLLPWLANNPFLYQTMDQNTKFTFWRECSYLAKIGRTSIDLDYTRYDESNLKSFVIICIKKLFRLASKIAGEHREDVKMCLRRTLYILENADIEVLDLIDGEAVARYIPWNNGLPTGFLWTWLINALFNAGVNLHVAEVLGLKYDKMVVQGDDIHIMGELTLNDYNAICKLCNDFGLRVNLTKSKFNADGEGEFLALAWHGNEVYGDRWRMLRALMWSSDDEMDNSDMYTKMNSRVQLWTQYLARKGSIVENWVIDDLFNAVKHQVKKLTIRNMLKTAVANGGFALFGNEVLNEYTWTTRNGGEVVVKVPFKSTVKQWNYQKANKAWRRGMVANLKSMAREQDGQNLQVLTIGKKSYTSLVTALGHKRRYNLFTEGLQRLPFAPKNIHPFDRTNGKVFDLQVLLSGLRYGELTGHPYIDIQLKQWYAKCTPRVWPDVASVKGLPVASMTPNLVLRYSEGLAPLVCPNAIYNVCTLVNSKRVTKQTLYIAQLYTELMLPQELGLIDLSSHGVKGTALGYGIWGDGLHIGTASERLLRKGLGGL
jgi:hypothetical protein